MDLEVRAGVANPFAGPHPLLIAGVLENVFEYCGFKELTVCRLVSKDWHKNSLKRWRSLAKVKLDTGGDRRRRPVSKLMDFVKREEKKNGSFKPYSGYFVIGGVRNLDPFLKGFGLQISALELKDVVFENVGEFRKVLFQSCPNMKELALLNPIQVMSWSNNVSEPETWVEPQFGENLNLKRLTLPHNTKSFEITRMEILSHFPSLEVLIQKWGLQGGPTSITFFDVNLFNVVEIIRNHDHRKLQLKSIEDLEISEPISHPNFLGGSCFPASFVRLLQNAPKVSLEHLTVSIAGSTMTATRSLRNEIIFQQRETLRKLELFRHPHHYKFLDASKVFDGELQLENLEELTLRSCVFSSLYFLVAMPNLKKLTIYGMEDLFGCYGNIVKGTRWLSPSIRNLALDKCTELYLGFRLSVNDLKFVVRVFPNVEKVTISLNNEMFAVVCENWRKLVEMKVFDSRLDDAGITGLNSVEVSLANLKRSLPMRQEGRRKSPNISFLPRLRRLSISNWEQRKITRSFGHASATFGFQRVPGLQYLHITNYHVEEDVKEAMRAHATSCVFTRITSDMETMLKRLKEDLY